jgi:hypothetical protein
MPDCQVDPLHRRKWYRFSPASKANNNGKSSLLRFFPLVRQTMEARTQGPLLWFGDDVDFGDFEQARCREAKERSIVVEMEMEGAAVDPTNDGSIPRFWASSEITEHDGAAYVSSVDLRFQGKLARLSTAPGETSMEVRVFEERESECLFAAELPIVKGHGLFPRFRDTSILERDLAIQLRDRLEALIRRAASDGEASDMLARLRSPEPWLHYGSLSRSLAALGLPSDWSQADVELQKIWFLRQLLDVCWRADRALEVFATSMKYIGPARVGPQRFYRIQQLASDRIDREGQNLAMFLYMLSKPDQDRLAAWMEKHFGFRTSVALEGSHLALKINEHGRAYNLVDTGYGFSQLLPIAVQCWAAAAYPLKDREVSPPSLLALEQPELHLHPRYQGRLADMLLGLVSVQREQASSWPRVLVETHSEALLERLGELVEQGRLEREDVLVLLVERDAATGISSVRQSQFDEKGVLENWPIGFFTPWSS